MRTEKKLVVKRKSLGQVVGEELLSLIRTGEWSPGEKLPSEQLLMQRVPTTSGLPFGSQRPCFSVMPLRLGMRF